MGSLSTMMIPSVKNIVLCFDGTENNFNRQHPTNVLKVYKLLQNDNPEEQICYYQPGIGNDITVGLGGSGKSMISTVWQHLSSKLDSAFANSVDYHVAQAYTYLMNYYHPGDRIYVFGFSRGSFIARILVGMIEKIGLLNKGLEVMVPTAWEIYQRWERDGQRFDGSNRANSIAREFKKTFCLETVDVEFMGLWDSVNSCGIIRDRFFPYTSITYHVKHIRHAVSINEQRAKFKHNLFNPYVYHEEPYQVNTSNSSGDLESSEETLESECRSLCPSTVSSDLLEVWFPGDHSDVGGAWPVDLKGHSLSNIPLRWILSFAIEFGVKFKRGSIHEFSRKFPSLDSLLSCHHNCLCLIRHQPVQHKPDPSFVLRLYEDIVGENGVIDPTSDDSLFCNPIQMSTTLPKTTLVKSDCRGDDSFWMALTWCLFEILPVGYFADNSHAGQFQRVYTPNFARSRIIPNNCKIHWSVLWRGRFIEDFKYSNLPDSYKLLLHKAKRSSHLPKYRDDEDETDDGSYGSSGSSGSSQIEQLSTAIQDELIDYNSGVVNLHSISADLNLDGLNWNRIPDELTRWMELNPDL